MSEPYAYYCKQCGNLFDSKKMNAKFCSLECANIAQGWNRLATVVAAPPTVYATHAGGIVTCPHGHMQGGRCGDCYREGVRAK